MARRGSSDPARRRGAAEPREAAPATPSARLVPDGRFLPIGMVEAPSTWVEDLTEKRLHVGSGRFPPGLFGLPEGRVASGKPGEARREDAEARRFVSETNLAK